MSPRPIGPEAVSNVRLLLMDVDGVLTDGRLWFGAEGFAAKAFHVRDGHGIAMLHRAGVLTGIVSGRSEDFVRRRADELKMRFIALGAEDKAEIVARALAELGVAKDAAAFVGDDVNDIPAFEQVAVSIAVHDAHPLALQRAGFCTSRAGGQGAIREVADAILTARASSSARSPRPANPTGPDR